METLVVAMEHRNQYYGKKSIGQDDRFSSAPSKTFRQINCRTIESGMSLVSRPKRTSIPLTKGDFPPVQSPQSPKSVLPVFDHPYVDISRSSPIPIANTKVSSEFVDQRRSLSYSELWAGPTYSNSPPPGSVPIPKFSLKQKRTVSLSLPGHDSAAVILEVAKSAPVSPTSSGDNPFLSTVSATMTLRRMLNLEFADE